MPSLLEIGGRRLPFLRWSALRMMLGMRHLTKEWQVGDGRERALGDHVLATAPPGDLDAAIDAVDAFCYGTSLMMNVGDEKGALLDAAIVRAQPQALLEIGTYCGYSALRTARVMPATAHLTTLEFNADNTQIARAILAHAGVADRVTVVNGTLDDGHTIDELPIQAGGLDFVFIDHAKELYVPDLERILAKGWLHAGSVVVADNVRVPGAPAYRRFMREHADEWDTVEHETHVEYQSLIKDLVLESTRLR